MCQRGRCAPPRLSVLRIALAHLHLELGGFRWKLGQWLKYFLTVRDI
jgi:hypothetical protein